MVPGTQRNFVLDIHHYARLYTSIVTLSIARMNSLLLVDPIYAIIAPSCSSQPFRKSAPAVSPKMRGRGRVWNGDMSIAENLSRVRERISAAAARSGTDPESISLVAVTKTVDVPRIQEAIQAGVTDIGENYVQDSVVKFETIGRAVRWHMIGHLQVNKVRHALPIFDLIQSVDSINLAKEIGRRSLALGKVSRMLVEVNISGEATKFGVQPVDTLAFCEAVAGVEGVELAGLMGIAPFVDDPSAIRRSFANLKALWDRLPAEHRKWLSMGMTSDFEIAIEEGSNMVRIGTAIFGPRG